MVGKLPVKKWTIIISWKFSHWQLMFRPYCKDDDLSDNDGGEFVKSGDDFVNAKSRRGLKTNFIPTLDVSKSPLSKFTSDDEQKRLWLSRDRNNTVINRELWSKKSDIVKIAYEIVDWQKSNLRSNRLSNNYQTVKSHKFTRFNSSVSLMYHVFKNFSCRLRSLEI